jgi:hypothetical protein
MAETSELTLMFYFASDNPFALSTVSRLKALKQSNSIPKPTSSYVLTKPQTAGMKCFVDFIHTE